MTDGKVYTVTTVNPGTREAVVTARGGDADLADRDAERFARRHGAKSIEIRRPGRAVIRGLRSY